MSQDPVDKAKRGELSDAEVDALVADTEAGRLSVDPYDVIYVVGLTWAQRHEGFVRRYLAFRADPMLARIALQVVVDHFGLLSKYRDDVVRFAAGVSWDEDGDVRVLALSQARHLVKQGDDEARDLLLRIADDEREDEFDRQVALGSLAEALGVPRTELPPTTRLWPADGAEFRALRAEVERRLDTESQATGR